MCDTFAGDAVQEDKSVPSHVPSYTGITEEVCEPLSVPLIEIVGKVPIVGG